MRKSRFSEEQITMALRQGEAGTPVEEICRKLGVSPDLPPSCGPIRVTALRDLKGPPILVHYGSKFSSR